MSIMNVCAKFNLVNNGGSTDRLPSTPRAMQKNISHAVKGKQSSDASKQVLISCVNLLTQT